MFTYLDIQKHEIYYYTVYPRTDRLIQIKCEILDIFCTISHSLLCNLKGRPIKGAVVLTFVNDTKPKMYHGCTSNTISSKKFRVNLLVVFPGLCFSSDVRHSHLSFFLVHRVRV